jgi:hypothetical protein
MVEVVAWVAETTTTQEVEAVEELVWLAELVRLRTPVLAATQPLKVLRQGIVWEAVAR